MTQNSDIISVILVGGTGVGKSQLGNIILNKEVFKVGNTFNSETKEKKEEFGRLGNLDVRVIDTPGFFDTEEHNMNNIDIQKKIVKLFIDDKSIDGIIFVFNFQELRKGQHYKDLIKDLKNIFEIDILKKRLKIIFTHADYGEGYDEDEEKKQKNEMIKFFGDDIIGKEDMIFVNTKKTIVYKYIKNIIELFKKFYQIKKKYGSMDNQKMEKKKKELEKMKKQQENPNELTQKLKIVQELIENRERKIYNIERDIDEYRRKIKGAEKGIAASSVFTVFTLGLSGIGIAHCMDEKKSFEASISRLEREKYEEQKKLNDLKSKEKKILDEMEKLVYD